MELLLPVVAARDPSLASGRRTTNYGRRVQDRGATVR